MLSDEQLRQIEARLRKAYPPMHPMAMQGSGADRDKYAAMAMGAQSAPVPESARRDLAALLAEVERLRGEVRQLESRLEEADDALAYSQEHSELP